MFWDSSIYLVLFYCWVIIPLFGFVTICYSFSCLVSSPNRMVLIRSGQFKVEEGEGNTLVSCELVPQKFGNVLVHLVMLEDKDLTNISPLFLCTGYGRSPCLSRLLWVSPFIFARAERGVSFPSLLGNWYPTKSENGGFGDSFALVALMPPS